MQKAIYDRDFDLGDGEIVNVSTNDSLLYEPYRLSSYQIELINDCWQDIKKPKTITIIEKHIKKFPKVPHFEELRVAHVLNVKTSNITIKDENKYEQAVRRSYLKHPEHFFAKMHMARVHLYHQEYSEISNLYGETLKLSVAFPDRKVFHISEMTAFLYFSVSYFIGKGRVYDAQKRLYQMSFINPSSIMYEKAQEIIRTHINDMDKGPAPENLIITSDFESSLEEYSFSSNIKKLILQLNDAFNAKNVDNPNLLVRLQIAADKHPEVPHFKSLIAQYYLINKNLENLVPAIQDVYNSFPDFFIAKLLFSELLLKTAPKEEGLQQIFKIYNPELILDPEVKKTYTVQEFIKFQFLAGRVWLLTKKPNQAKECLFAISKIDTDFHEYKALNKLVNNFYTKHTNNLN